LSGINKKLSAARRKWHIYWAAAAGPFYYGDFRFTWSTCVDDRAVAVAAAAAAVNVDCFVVLLSCQGIPKVTNLHFHHLF
jgi:hypothetical protein